MDANIESAKNSKKFECKICNYVCSKSWNMKTHLLSTKHKNANFGLTDEHGFQPKKMFICVCGKEFKHNPSLSRHKKVCTNAQTQGTTNKSSTDILDIVLELVKSNSSFQQQMLEICKTSNTIVSNSNNNLNNKTFNLQVFLNETCKDAMNIVDFVKSVQLQLSDLESVGEQGYINGISNIIIKNLKAIDEHLRPVHCSDLKRKSIYIKDNNKWQKEDANHNKMKSLIRSIAHKNMRLIPQFKEKYPDCERSDSKKSDDYNKLYIECMGGPGDNMDEKSNKIISKILKEILIEK